MIPLCLIVSGPAGAGKTTLARRLATELALPLMTKDTIKERLFEILGTADRAWSRRLVGASMELLYVFAEALLAASQSCIVEGNFSAEYGAPAFRRIGARVRFLPIQVNCVADPALLAARIRTRALSGERHPGHQDHLAPVPGLDTPVPGRLDPLDIGGHVIEVDTSDFDRLDTAHLCDQIRRLWLQEGRQESQESG